MRKLACIICFSVLCCACQAQVKMYTAECVKEYPHDTKSYTQGLFFYDSELYESTGQWGESTFRKVDLSNGKPLRKLTFSDKYFIEGSAILDGKLFILTWTNKVIFIYDAETLEYRQTYSYPREGWGLTTDGKQLIASDGSNHLYFLDSNLKLQRTVNVTLNGKALKYLNELELIDGKIWANIYTTDMIAIINPENGKVEGMVDCSSLMPPSKRTAHMDVLNGIALNPDDGRIYLTGKYWPKMFEVRIVPQSKKR